MAGLGIKLGSLQARDAENWVIREMSAGRSGNQTQDTS